MSIDRSESMDGSSSGVFVAPAAAAVAASANKGQSIVLAGSKSAHSSLEMEDLFSEILRKTGAGEQSS